MVLRQQLLLHGLSGESGTPNLHNGEESAGIFTGIVFFCVTQLSGTNLAKNLVLRHLPFFPGAMSGFVGYPPAVAL